MKKLLRNKRKGYAHFSYVKTLHNPEPNPNILTLHVSYGGLLVKQSKAAKRLREERAKPWNYLKSYATHLPLKLLYTPTGHKENT